MTSLVARADSSNPAALVDGLRRVGAGTTGLDAWINVHTYLVQMLQKFQTQLDPLQQVAKDIVRPFEEGGSGGESPFVQWYRDASRHVRVLRCVFEDDDVNPALVREIQLRNADSGVLGEQYREGSLVIEPDTNHFDLVRPEVVARQLEELMREVKAAAMAGAQG